MIVRSHKATASFVLSVLILFLGQTSACAGERRCFSDIAAYMVAEFGPSYSEDENLINSSRQFGRESFIVVQDLTSGTNHTFALLKADGTRICLLLVTDPVVSLDVSELDKAGFPTELVARDQASPGAPEHEIRYRYSTHQQYYEPHRCYELRYRGSETLRTKTNCYRLRD